MGAPRLCGARNRAVGCGHVSDRQRVAGVVPTVTGPVTVPEAAARLARLGFVVVNGTRPAEPGGAQLLVALRDHPTLEHFDPETVQHWEYSQGKGRIVDITRASHLPLHRPFSWGTIRATDRLEVYNSFLTFGGELEADRVDAATVALVFRSPAPLVRWTGHSQSVDPLAGEVGAFFARMMVPIDFVPGTEERVGLASPLELYAAFLESAGRRRVRPQSGAGAADDGTASWLAGEARRIREVAPAAWTTGSALAAELHLDVG